MEDRICEYRSTDKESMFEFFTQVCTEIGYEIDLLSRHLDLTDIPGCYQTHDGQFWMIKSTSDSSIVGSIAIRRLAPKIYELKRFYVLRSERGRGLGHVLIEKLFDRARNIDCDRIRLDTTHRATAAIHLFEKYGFTRIDRYNDNPHAEIFMECFIDRVTRRE